MQYIYKVRPKGPGIFSVDISDTETANAHPVLTAEDNPRENLKREVQSYVGMNNGLQASHDIK